MQLALPSRDYYLKEDSEGDLKAYHRYMTEVAKLMGANASQAAEQLQEVIWFEKALANVSTDHNRHSPITSLLDPCLKEVTDKQNTNLHKRQVNKVKVKYSCLCNSL
jgi:predicted metalloendopeptidase